MGSNLTIALGPVVNVLDSAGKDKHAIRQRYCEGANWKNSILLVKTVLDKAVISVAMTSDNFCGT